jgi:sialate O-acetylesterase
MKENLLANIFCEGAILQRGKPVQVWGWSKGGDKPIVVRLISGLSKKELSKANHSNVYDTEVIVEEVHGRTSPKDKSWEVILSSRREGGPYVLEVSVGVDRQRVEDIYFGEVWICGGQSNMEWPMSQVRRMFPHEITDANNPLIRQYKVPLDYSFNGPVSDVNKSEWRKVCPDNIGDFSAVGYFFAKELYERLQVPIGLVMTAVGGTPIEAWMSEEMLAEFPDSIAHLEPYKDENYLKDVRKAEENQTNNWYRQIENLEIGLIEGWYEEKFTDKEWNEAKLTFPWDEEEELKGSGVVWFRYQVNIPSELAGKSAFLQLGCIMDVDVVYVNGEKVGSSDNRYSPRDYPVTNIYDCSFV